MANQKDSPFAKRMKRHKTSPLTDEALSAQERGEKWARKVLPKPKTIASEERMQASLKVGPCRKTSFVSKQKALLRIDELQEANPKGNQVKYCYRCPHCRHWHLTSEPPKRKQNS